MDDGIREVRDVMKKLVMGDLGDVVSTRDWLCPIDAEPYLGEQSVSHPSGPDLGHRDNTGTVATVSEMRATMAGSTASSRR